MPSKAKRSAHVPASPIGNDPASKNVGSKSSATGNPTGPSSSASKPGPVPQGSYPAAANDVASKPVAEHPVLQPTGVNRKKQKRRNKQAARLAAADHQLHGDGLSAPSVAQNGNPASSSLQGDEDEYTADDAYDTDDDDDDDDDPRDSAQPHSRSASENNGVEHQSHAHGSQKSNKKGKQNRSGAHVQEESSASLPTPSAPVARPLGPPPLSNAALRSAHKVSKDRIWNTSTQEERENIKEFWLELGEEERRSLVKVEKEAVLRKMKEQQKHSCSCTVCGRKRTAIEEELEVLYDAYYEELEQYANHNHAAFENGTNSRRLYQPPLHSLERHPHLYSPQHPSRGKVQELPDDEDLEDDYDEDEEDEDDEPYSEDELDEATRATRADFFAFGNSLTVKDGILTVADDLLKNDGKHFIDMMEQLAERRMQREEDTQYAAATAAHQSMHSGHNHGPPLEDDEYDDEEDEEYDSQDDEEYDDDEMDSMTEEQRMEEGRRMFQIFAARMFEQRVLTAYREKVARERQQKLIEELEEETRLDVEREAKKAREAQKKKDKKRLQKQAKEEEKAKREAERAAEEAEKKAQEQRRLEEQRRKKEEQRKKREAEKKAQEEERLRKEAERQKRQREERERQEESERKQREQKERERKKREEAKKKEREEQEAKEKELREKKAKEERERQAREEQERQQKEAADKAADKAERESKEKAKREDQAMQQAAQAAAVQAAKRASHAGHPQVPPGLHHPQGPASVQSPHFQVATPIVPKASTPVRPRQPSHQGSHASSPRSQAAGADSSHPSISPGGAAASQSSGSSSAAPSKTVSQAPTLHHPQPGPPMSPLGSASRASSHPTGFNAMPSTAGMGSSAPGPPGMPQQHRFPISQEMPLYPNHAGPVGGQYRSPENVPVPPGINPSRPPLSGRGYPLDTSHTGLPFHPHPQHPPSHMPSGAASQSGIGSHARQSSASMERSPLETQPQNVAISRPTPIQRPSSTEQGKDDAKSGPSDVEGLTARLGSSALLDDTDIPLTTGSSQPMPVGIPPGPPASTRLGFGASPFHTEPLSSTNAASFPLGASGSGGGTWGSQMPFGTPGFASPSTWGAGLGWSNNTFGAVGGFPRPHTSRPVTIRLMVIQACKQLDTTGHSNGNSGFHDVKHVLRLVEQLGHPSDGQVPLSEMIDICDTEGNTQNGGGSFVIKNEGSRGTFVKFEPDNNIAPTGTARRGIAPGDIGSPIPSGSAVAPGAIGLTNTSRQYTS